MSLLKSGAKLIAVDDQPVLALRIRLANDNVPSDIPANLIFNAAT
jgi:hypothetical protein